MRKLILLFALMGCASPAEDYVRAEAATWAVFDQPYDATQPHKIDAWIDGDAGLSVETKSAMHMLNQARRARVSHAIAAIGS